ncbi:MAG: hypothetical protein DHS20C15_23920 [Planctomycetota bacterium]|nr:MAG: hypothetical protein DHS20C15_23920 [Planctomycetota bacterium]
MAEVETARQVLAGIPWARMVGVAVISAVAVTLAQTLLFGDANPAVTGGVTAALTATVGMRSETAVAGAPSDEEL